MSFFGFVSSFCDSKSRMRAFAISAQALKYLSFSGGSFSFLDSLTLRFGLTVVIVSVAILAV